MDWLKTIFGGAGGVTDIIKTTGDAIGQFVEKPEDRLKVQQALAEADLAVKKLQMDAMMAQLQDVQGARELYGKDNGVQKALAILFTVAFFGFMGFILWFMKDGNLTNDQSNLIFTMFGAISGIMVTVIGFYFGSSSGSQGKDMMVKNLTQVQKQPGTQ